VEVSLGLLKVQRLDGVSRMAFGKVSNVN